MLRAAQELVSGCWWNFTAILSCVGWTILGAAIGGIFAGFYGLLLGILDALLHGELIRIAADSTYFSLCGAAAGGLLGGFTRIIDPEGIVTLLSFRTGLDMTDTH
jgi:hypothetical protein